jgi:hypothetical protein
MNWVVTIYVVILFFLLTPNILLRLPPNGNKYMVAATHGIVFAIVLCFTYKYVLEMSTKTLGQIATTTTAPHK